MEIIQEREPPKSLQEEASEVFYEWALDHERDSEKSGGKITAIEFDPLTYPEQRLEVPVVPILDLYKQVPEELFLAGLHQKFTDALGSPETSEKLIEYVRSLPTSEHNPKPLIVSIQEELDKGESIAVIFGHQILMDMGFGMAALTEAQGTTKYLNRNVAILNKAMAFEKFNGQTYTEMTTPIGNMVFVSPKTESAKKRNISDNLASAINFSAGRVIREFDKAGALYFVAFHGTTLKEKSTGSYLMPPIDPASGGLIQNCKYLLRFALVKKNGDIRWDIGPLEELNPKGANKHERRKNMLQLAEEAQLKLAQQMANLLGKTVEVQESKDKLTAGRAAFQLLFPKD
jgi:hypothetical protein